MSDEEEDYPSIGDRRGSRTLVAMGDDWPDEWADWLDDLVARHRVLVDSAIEADLPTENFGLEEEGEGDMDFARLLGVDFDSTFWEGACISGHFQLGWIATRAIPAARRKGMRYLEQKERELLKAVRNKVFAEMKAITDLDELVSRTRDDREAARASIEHLTAQLDAEASASRQRETAVRDLEDKLHRARIAEQMGKDCTRLACALMGRHKRRQFAGPLLLWDDGTLYAIVSQGGVSIPEDSPHAAVLAAAKAAGLRVVEVRDERIVRHGLASSAPVRGSADIADWVNVWSPPPREGMTRLVHPDPEIQEQVMNIHRQLSAKVH